MRAVFSSILQECHQVGSEAAVAINTVHCFVLGTRVISEDVLPEDLEFWEAVLRGTQAEVDSCIEKCILLAQIQVCDENV